MTGDWPWMRFGRQMSAGLVTSGRQQLGHDLTAALALAAVAIPEQVATARLAGMPAAAGLMVFIAGSLGFFLLGANRSLSVGADTTIAPLVAGGLALLATAGTLHYQAHAALLALMVGIIVTAGGAFRMGWIARLLSIPVITGFLAGIAVHIAVSQLPAVLGIPNTQSDFFSTISNLARNVTHLNALALAIATCVFAMTFVCEKIDIRLPGALIAIVLASLAVWLSGSASVPVLGAVSSAQMRAALPGITYADIGRLLPIALIVSLG